jgi:hypothetical protein
MQARQGGLINMRSILGIVVVGVLVVSCSQMSNTNKTPEDTEGNITEHDHRVLVAIEDCRSRGLIGQKDTLDNAKGMVEWRRRILESSGTVVTEQSVFDIVSRGHYDVYLVISAPPPEGVMAFRDGRVLVVIDSSDHTRIGLIHMR